MEFEKLKLRRRHEDDFDFRTETRLKVQQSLQNLNIGQNKRRSYKPESRPSLLIGIDFGTTYSGVAWAWSGDLEDIHVVTNWKARGVNLAHVREDGKAPTAIHYTRDGIFWGYGIKEDEDPIRWFKLLLLKEEDIPEDIQEFKYLKKARAQIEKLGRRPEDVVADYLKMLWRHTIASMDRANVGSIDGLPFKVVLTVPAIWKPYAKQAMEQAAHQAGITAPRAIGDTSLIVVSEPEAAALATLSEPRGRSMMQENDVFIVCDVGGGTTIKDIISYKIMQREPLILDECVEGKGRLCGAMLVDDGFENLISTRIGPKWKKISRASYVKLMSDGWEYGIKRAFDGAKDTRWTIQLPPDVVGMRQAITGVDDKRKDAPMRGGQIEFRSGHIKGIFDRVINSIRALISDQIKAIQAKENKLPRAIILVGGFGSCEFLWQRLYDEHHGKGIDVVQAGGRLPWTAICRGAVRRAAVNVVRRRIARYSYGACSDPKFKKGIHLEHERYLDTDDGVERAAEQMSWYVIKGQDIEVLEPLTFNFHNTFREDELPDGDYSVTIYQCYSAKPPPRFAKDVKPLCNITVRNVAWERLPRKLDIFNKPYFRFDYDVEMIREDERVQFRVLVNGERKGSRDVRVELEPTC